MNTTAVLLAFDTAAPTVAAALAVVAEVEPAGRWTIAGPGGDGNTLPAATAFLAIAFLAGLVG